MVRAAAKNFESVGVVVDPARYGPLIDELRREGGLTRADQAGALGRGVRPHGRLRRGGGLVVRRAGRRRGLPSFVGLAYEKIGDLRYGENPHQRGALYREAAGAGPLGGARVLQGKDMSFNNWLDAYAAHELAAAMPEGSAVIVKHNNPCGAAARESLADSYRRGVRLRRGERLRRHRGVPRRGRRRRRDGDARRVHRGRDRPVVSAAAAEPAFAERPEPARGRRRRLPDGAGLDVRPLPGGALVQDRDVVSETRSGLEGRIESGADGSRMGRPRARVDDRLAREVEHDRAGEATGRPSASAPGQMSRVDASWIARRKAGERARGAVVASDAFFPFPDALEVAADAGCTAVIHPGRVEGRRGRARRRRGARHGGRAHRRTALPSLTRAWSGVQAPG